MKLHLLFFLFICSIFFNSCSLYPPISESLIFNEDLNSNDKTKLFSFPRVALSNSIVSSTIPSKYLEKNTTDSSSKSLNKLWQFSFSNIGILYRVNNDFYLGLNSNLLFNAGIDLTYEVVDNYFITAEATLLNNYKVIVQKRIVTSVDFTNTIGIVYRHDRLGFRENSFSGNAINFYINSIGIRSLNGFKLFNKELIFEISLLYELEYKAEVINLSFSYNFYKFFN
ncbi:MAG: hypothetical protein Q8N03_15570 [Ignavibacteria bacterium]|nr:hypothetical protein [Ignavibacteria bacterium]